MGIRIEMVLNLINKKIQQYYSIMKQNNQSNSELAQYKLKRYKNRFYTPTIFADNDEISHNIKCQTFLSDDKLDIIKPNPEIPTSVIYQKKYRVHNRNFTEVSQQPKALKFVTIQNIKNFRNKSKIILPYINHEQREQNLLCNKRQKGNNMNTIILHNNKDQLNQQINISDIKIRQKYRSNSIQIDQFWKKLRSKRQSIEVKYNNGNINKIIVVYELKKNRCRSQKMSSQSSINSMNFSKDMKLKIQKIKKQPMNFNFFQLPTLFIEDIQAKLSQKEQQNPVKYKNCKLKISYIPSKIELQLFINMYKPTNKQVIIEKLLKSNFFRIQYYKNQVYFGQMIGKQKNGEGILINKKKCFEGYWKHDKKIRGVQISHIGIYKGDFLDQMRDGYGEFKWNNDEFYVGEWKKDKRNGSGLWLNKYDDSYNGTWKNGKMDGYGQMINQKNKYKGVYLNSQKHGWGRQCFINGDSFEGIYKQGLPNGNGLYRWKNGTFYQGQLYGGLRNGYGVMKSSFGLIYIGDFKLDKMQGQCQIYMPNGDYYQGGFKDSHKNGRGALTIQKKNLILKGYWKDDILQKQIYH